MNALDALILLIEDDLQTRRFLKSNLTLNGWACTEAKNAQLGLESLRNEFPDMVILDLGLPDMNGIEVIKHIRQYSEIPILILSARGLEVDKIAALEAGADDYLTKPFSNGELNARLQALLRRARRAGALHDVFVSGELMVNLAQRRVTLADQEVHLTPIEYNLLAQLVRHAGLVLTHRHLLKTIWGSEHIHDSHYLRIYMGQLRHKLELDPARPKYLLTEVGVGYRLAVDDSPTGLNDIPKMA